MDSLARLRLLSGQMALEPAEETRRCQYSQKQDQVHISPAQMPNGKQILLLKTLLTSACERNCFYCPFRAGRDFHRATFKPEEFAKLFVSLVQARAADGIFLSSAVAGGGIRTQDKLLETAEILRYKFGFKGYIHLKIMPGAEKAQVERAMQLANRLSTNLEAPNPSRLETLAPQKAFVEELLRPLRWIDEIRQNSTPHHAFNGFWPSSATQFVVGGSDESDLETLTTTQWLIKHVNLKRAYFSAFNPVPDTPLENKPPTHPMREHRLFQASYLLRDYGYDLEEIPFDKNGNLSLDSDPKYAWAQENLVHQPLEVNKAERNQLLRVPGIGLKNAETIISARRVKKITDISSLRGLGMAAPDRAAPFLLFDGRQAPYQIPLL